MLKKEPALIVQLLAAAITLAVAFGLPITDEQREAILQFAAIAVTIMIGSGLLTRSLVYAPDTVSRIAAEAWEQGVESADFKKAAHK